MMHPLCAELQRATERNLPEVQVGFDDYQRECFVARPAEFFALELCGEAGELANLVKKQWKGRDIDARHLADEAADVFIALMNYCNAAGIKLAPAVADKLSRIPPSK
jgi:NTP pyrophosphatase (non-canonical NTP hydrolase)